MEHSSVDLAQEASDLQHLSASMAKLQEMHSQLRDLRDAVPSLLRPMRGVGGPPEIVYAEFLKAARKAVEDTKDFAVVMKTTANQEVLSEARASKIKSPNGIVAWLADQQDDWSQKSLSVDMKKESSFDAQTLDGTALLGREEALQAFQASHPEAKLSDLANEQEIAYALPDAGLLFRIQTTHADVKQPSYSILCQNLSDPMAQARLYTDIAQALSTRPKQHDLGYTLELLRSYSDLMSRACSKCNRVIDAYGSFPYHRYQQLENQISQFQALHEGCLSV